MSRRSWFYAVLIAISAMLVVLAVVLHDSAPWMGGAAGAFAGGVVLVALRNWYRKRHQ